MGAYIINLEEFKSMVTHSIALYVNAENVHTLIVLELNILHIPK